MRMLQCVHRPVFGVYKSSRFLVRFSQPGHFPSSVQGSQQIEYPLMLRGGEGRGAGQLNKNIGKFHANINRFLFFL